jgi:hypothetical protein
MKPPATPVWAWWTFFPGGCESMSSVETTHTYALLLCAAPGLGQEVASEIALLHALDATDEIHVWVPGPDSEAIRGLVSANGWEKVVAVNPARATRDATVLDALTAIRQSARGEDLVLISDVEQRSLTESAASACLSLAADQGAALIASRVAGDVIHVAESGKTAGLPLEDLTFLATGPLVTQFGRMFELYDWASTVAQDSIESPYRWSLARLKAVVLVPNDRGELEQASEIIRAFLETH